MKNLVCSFCLFIFPIAANSEESAICESLVNDINIERYFAENRVKELPSSNERLFIDGSSESGTCRGQSAWREKDGNKESIKYVCDENGCASGADASIVAWNNSTYILTERPDTGEFEKLNGWDKLSKNEQALIKFRSLTRDLYKILPESAKAVDLCERYDWSTRYLNEKLIFGEGECLLLQNSQGRSLFRAHLYDNRSLLETSFPTLQTRPSAKYKIDKLHIDLNRKVSVDLDGDGKLENIVPVEGNSGAGCGCDIESVMLLDDQNQPLQPNDSFSENFSLFAQQLSCGDKIDVMVKYSAFYLQKTSRLGVRQLYRISDTSVPICNFVNESPLLPLSN